MALVQQEKEFNNITECLHELMTSKVTAEVVRNNFMLHEETGLPAIFSRLYSKGVQYQFYHIADAWELYALWFRQIFDPDLFRGVVVGRKANGKLGRLSTADRLDPAYQLRLKGDYFGNQTLSNGQWWPRQICCVRDGAHNSMQGGISGKVGEGAFSCILAGGYKYDIDEGDRIWYCGTDSTDGEVSANTQRLIESVTSQQPVRIIRSSGGHNKVISPKEGYRYDGLYNVRGYEILDRAKQRHRFELVRQAGQDPIRCSGPGVRPTTHELAALELANKEREFLA
ncbi:hypothetical protein MBLNU459_g2281t1 [Dothideomycetes sp. NU459]